MPILFRQMKKKKKTRRHRETSMTLREIFTGKRKNEVKGIACWAISLLLGLAFWPHAADQNLIGPIGEILFRLGFAFSGVLVFVLPLAITVYGVVVFREKEVERKSFKLLGLIIGMTAVGIIIELVHPDPILFEKVDSFYNWTDAQAFWKKFPPILQLWYAVTMPAGGLIAQGLTYLLKTVFSTIGTAIISGTMLVLALYLLELEPYLLKVIKQVKTGLWSTVQQGKLEGKKRFNYAKTQPIPDQNASLLEQSARPKIKINAKPKTASEQAEKPTSKADAVSSSVNDHEINSVAIVEEGKYYQLPGLSLLTEPISNPALGTEYFEAMSKTLEQALAQFGVAAKVVEVCPGPVVTRYELQPSPGVKINRILSLADDIALTMRAAHVRIEAPIPGKGAVGIEVPNQEKEIVVIKELLAAELFHQQKTLLTFAVGKDIGGDMIYGDLSAMPHLLIAGATGSGKSACINGLISSILYRAKPNQVKFLMIDPKRVELTTYNGIPHLLSPVITDSREAASALRLVVHEMEERYKRLANLGVRDIGDYNQRVAEERAQLAESGQTSEHDQQQPLLTFMPYIVVVIDELADLMLVAANEVENTIARLAQMARAVGIHMVLATQRPSVDVITGVIKANFPSRIAFQVSSKVDSRTILDVNGADALLGKGDMLYSLASLNKPIRVQGVFITTKEVEQVVRFWKKQGAPTFDQSFSQEKLQATATGKTGTGGEDDELYQQAVMWAIRAKQASTSMLQRRLKVGYARAARLVDLMEENGIVGPSEGSKPRKVLVDEDMGYAVDEQTKAI